MNELHTAIAMMVIFCLIGIILPVFIMIRDKSQQSALPNKLILWITMIFCMMLVFGIVVDFQNLSETLRGDLVQYSFIAIMLFGAIFGIDQLLKAKHIKSVKWRDLTVETSSAAEKASVSSFGKALEKVLSKKEPKDAKESDTAQSKLGDSNVEKENNEL